jgi:hypothetical protein
LKASLEPAFKTLEAQVLFLDQDLDLNLGRDLNHFPAIPAGSQWDLQRSWTKNFNQDFGKKFSNFLTDLNKDLVQIVF